MAIKGNTKLFTRISWCCLFSYIISELWGDGLWACSWLIRYSWWGCEYNMYHCWQNYTFNFWGKLMYVSCTTDRPGDSIGHPTGALAIICLWILLTWLTCAYGMLCQDEDAPGENFNPLMCMPIFRIGHFTSCTFISITEHHIIKWHVGHAWYGWWTIKHQSFGRSWGVMMALQWFAGA